MFTSGFYDSLKGDRKYSATQMSAIFDGIIEDGVYENVGDYFATVAGSGMQVVVKTGRAWFNHTWSLNDALLPLAIDASDVIQTRIDAVVLEVDARVEVRANQIKVIKGTLSTNPVKPTLSDGPDIWQYPLAYVTVNPGVTEITSADIEIMVGKGRTPFVTAPLTTVSLDDMWLQWEGEFNIWFDNLKAQLSGNVVANLQDQIDNKVAVADKATVEDLQNGTPGKWIDASMAKDELSGLVSGLKVGDIVFSLRNLEEETNGKLIACDQRTILKEAYPELCELPEMRGRYVDAFDEYVGKVEYQNPGSSSVSQMTYPITDSDIVVIDGEPYAVCAKALDGGDYPVYIHYINLNDPSKSLRADFLVTGSSNINKWKGTQSGGISYAHSVVNGYSYDLFSAYNSRTLEYRLAVLDIANNTTIGYYVSTVFHGALVKSKCTIHKLDDNKYLVISPQSVIQIITDEENGSMSSVIIPFVVPAGNTAPADGAGVIIGNSSDDVIPFYSRVQIDSAGRMYIMYKTATNTPTRYGVAILNIASSISMSLYSNIALPSYSDPRIFGIYNNTVYAFAKVDSDATTYGSTSLWRLMKYNKPNDNWEDALPECTLFNSDSDPAFCEKYTIGTEMHIVVYAYANVVSNSISGSVSSKKRYIDINLTTETAELVPYPTICELAGSDTLIINPNDCIQRNPIVTKRLGSPTRMRTGYTYERGDLSEVYAIEVLYHGIASILMAPSNSDYTQWLVPYHIKYKNKFYMFANGTGTIGTFLSAWDMDKRLAPFAKNGYIKALPNNGANSEAP